jgi:hypothetical protein
LIECRVTSRLRKNHFGTAEIRWPARMGQEEKTPASLAHLARLSCGNTLLLCQTCEPPRFSRASKFFRSLSNPTSQQQNDQDQEDQA